MTIAPPKDTPEYMTPAWVSCLSWALKQDDIVAQFRAATGNKWTPGKNGLEKMIDAASGADRAFIEAFVAWFNVEIWGRMDAEEECP